MNEWMNGWVNGGPQKTTAGSLPGEPVRGAWFGKRVFAEATKSRVSWGEHPDCSREPSVPGQVSLGETGGGSREGPVKAEAGIGVRGPGRGGRKDPPQSRGRKLSLPDHWASGLLARASVVVIIVREPMAVV